MKTAVALTVPLAIALFAQPLTDAGARQSAPPAEKQQTAPANPQSSAGSWRFTFGEANNVIRIAGPEAEYLLTATGIGDPIEKLPAGDLNTYAATLTVSDAGRVGRASTHTVAIGSPRFVGRSAPGALSWLVKLRADKLPAESTEKRLVTIAHGTGDTRAVHAVEYTLTNLPATAPQYDVAAPAHDWLVSWNAPDSERTYPLLISNKSEPLVDLRVALSALKRTDDGDNIGFGQIHLVTRADSRGAERIDLEPNETRTVFLRMDPPRRVGPYGAFGGQVQLISKGTSPKAVPITAKVTSDGVKLAGVLLVVLGLSVSIIVTNQLRPRALRLQALRPALILRDLLQQFIQRTTALAGNDAAGIVAEVDRQAARLNPDALDAEGLLPLAVNIEGGTASPTKLQALLDDISGRLAGAMVLRDGVIQLRKQAPLANRPAALSSAIDALNTFAGKATSAEVAHAEVTRVVASLDTGEEGLESFTTAAGPGPNPVSVQQLDFILHQTVNVAAFIWAAVSLAIGATYVWSDVDFGTWFDLLGAFLWGLGLTTFGASLQQLTPRTAATQLGLSVPKTTTNP